METFLMENKNLNDIVIEDADNSKKAQLKNILTLLALLFIILVISIVITKLILGSDEESSEATAITTEVNKSNEDTLNTTATSIAAGVATAAATTHALTNKEPSTNSSTRNSATTTKAPLLTERNSSSRTKAPLREEPTQTKAPKRRSTTTENHPPKRVSTYTRPKYVVNKRPVKTETKEPVKHLASATRGYYIKVGTFKDATTAVRNIKSIKLKYKTIKTKEGLTRVLIGPFYSQKDAQSHLAKAKAHVARDAYITKIK
jgi:cell division septation protein DedD